MKDIIAIVILSITTRFGDEWGQRLAAAFARNSTLVQISLRDIRISDRPGGPLCIISYYIHYHIIPSRVCLCLSFLGGALVAAYDHNPYLMELALSADEIGADVFKKLQEIFERKRAIVWRGQIENETLISASSEDIYDPDE